MYFVIPDPGNEAGFELHNQDDILMYANTASARRWFLPQFSNSLAHVKLGARMRVLNQQSGTITLMQTIHAGTCQSRTSTTIQFAESASDVDDFYNGKFVRINSGGIRVREISDYVGATRTATLSTAWGGTNQTSIVSYVVAETFLTVPSGEVGRIICNGAGQWIED